MKFTQMAKRAALSYLPHRVLKIVRTYHYRTSLKNYDIAAEPDLSACRNIIKFGDTVIDVGANIGVYTRFCSEFVGPTGHIFSLEPIPETFSYLERNVRTMKLKNVECWNFAVSDRDDDLERMSIPDYSTGGSNLYEARLSSEGSIAVKARKLDTLFPNLNPTFIKCDVEGHEIGCINGALNLIRRSRPRWMVEVSSAETFELFRSLGYEAFYWNGCEFHAFDSAHCSINYFFFPAR